MRALFSLMASCYIIAALVFPGLWLNGGLHLPLASWWPAYLALELVLVGAPVSYAVWYLVWAPVAALKAARPVHLARLLGTALLVVYGFLIVPAGCFISLPHGANVYAGFIALAIAAFAAMGYLMYMRRESRHG